MIKSDTALCRLMGGASLCALAFGAAFASPAMAQDNGSQVPVEETDATTAESSDEPVIVVTGSILPRANRETPSPVTVLTSEALDQRGINTVAEALQRVPAGNAGTIAQGWNTGFNFASGANAISLRGLTVQSTLSIFDGLRGAPYPLADDGQRNFVDLNTIPDAIVDRIEILRDGASATYGADAVAGVINVITKKEIQGLHLNASYGISEHGDGDERRIDATFGYGDLDVQGFNFYISGEYQKENVVWARDRDYPFNTSDLSRICNDAGTSCMNDLRFNAITAEDGSFNGLASVPGVALVRPVTTAGSATGSGRYQFLNPAAGCNGLPSVTVAPELSGTSPATACVYDIVAAEQMLRPEVERHGLSARFTVNLGEDHQLYVMGNYYVTDTLASFFPLNFNGLPTPPNPAGLAAYNVIQPVYVCATGVGTPNGVGTGCDANNGTLNPYNPFAAQGQTAQIALRSSRKRTVETNARALRAALGLSGTILDDWNYSVDFTASNVRLDRVQGGYIIPQRVMNASARGEIDFMNPLAIPDSVWDYIAPVNSTQSNSNLWQATGTIGRSLFELPGGPLQVAAGLAYRWESINAPSANPENLESPYSRYYSVNSVGTNGSRNVFSAFGEINAPIVEEFEINLAGRYDEYSTGQSNFSPKVGAKFMPIPELAFRGTWSKGFRIPSFNESFGLPTTGYVAATVSCTTNAAFCNAHNNNAYATAPYNIGLTQVGNPALDPEKSTSYTFGVIVEPIRNISFTIDFWRIEVEDLIVGVTNIGPVIEAYYANNGVVNIPGLTVTPGLPDPAFPDALPLLGFIQTPFVNADRQVVQGIDFGIQARYQLFPGVRLTSALDASYLDKNHLTPTDPATGEVQPRLDYEGTLSPCNVTSCSGSPQWRASWQNTLDFGATTVSATLYYTSGYDMAPIDYGGVKGDCAGNAVEHLVATYANGDPVLCEAKPTWNLDLTASHEITDNFTVYANVMNVLGIDAPFDPNAAYAIFQYNPAWAGPNIMGRYFRLGAKVSF